jgi:hypothetical protein
MGFGLPAAIGAKVACPDETVVCLAGDGSLIMNVQEFATAVHHDIPIKVFLMNNGYFGMVRQWQELFWEGRYSSVEMGDSPDWVKLAQASCRRSSESKVSCRAGRSACMRNLWVISSPASPDPREAVSHWRTRPTRPRAWLWRCELSMGHCCVRRVRLLCRRMEKSHCS